MTEHGEAIMAWFAEHHDGTLFELRDALLPRASRSASRLRIGSLSGTGRLVKKTGHALEQSRPDVLEYRQRWFDDQLDLDHTQLVFIDETWTATNMARTHGRCRKGERLRLGFPHAHRKTTTLVGGSRSTGMVAPLVIDGPINGEWFKAYVAKALVPPLKPLARDRENDRPRRAIRGPQVIHIMQVRSSFKGKRSKRWSCICERQSRAESGNQNVRAG